VLAGWVLLGDPLSGNLGAAAVLIALGIYLVNR
jgi:drug/metabolite transporter (DMT)-like permease